MHDVVGGARSTHVVLKAPEGFRAVGSQVSVDYFQPDDEDQDPVKEMIRTAITCRNWKRGIPSQEFRDDDNVPETAHVYVGELPLMVRDASFIVNLYAYRSGIIVQSLLSSWLMCGVITVYFIRILGNSFSIAKSFSSGSTSFAAAIIPVLLAAAVTVVTQHDSSRFASKCLAIPRVLLAVSATCCLAVAVLFALDDLGFWADFAWWSIELLVGLVAIRLTTGVIVHSFRVSKWRDRIFKTSRYLRDTQDREQLEVLRDYKSLLPPPFDLSKLPELKSPKMGKLQSILVRRGPRQFWRELPKIPAIDERADDFVSIRNAFAEWLTTEGCEYPQLCERCQEEFSDQDRAIRARDIKL